MSVASNARTTVAIDRDARVIVGYSDGSLAFVSMPPAHLSPSRDAPGPLQRESVVRRLRRVDEGAGTEGERGAQAGITALCPVWAPFGLLVVAGDSDGRLGLWTTSALQSGR